MRKRRARAIRRSRRAAAGSPTTSRAGSPSGASSSHSESRSGSSQTIDPTLPGLFAGDPPAEVLPLLEQLASAVRPKSLRTQLSIMAAADQRDLLPRIAVPTLLIWGELDARSPLTVARQFEEAIPDTKLVVIPRCGHVSNLEQPEQFNEAVREFCRAHSTRRPEAQRIAARDPCPRT